MIKTTGFAIWVPWFSDASPPSIHTKTRTVQAKDTSIQHLKDTTYLNKQKEYFVVIKENGTQ